MIKTRPIFLGILTALALACSPSEPKARVGSAAPEIELADLGGQTATLAQYRGRVVLLDFWATWCDTCTEEIPALKTLYKRFQGPNFELLAPSVDEGGRQAIVPFANEKNLPWRVLMANARATERYAVFGLPAKFLIDRNGVIVRSYTGPVDMSVLAEDIEQTLNRRNT